ncbi:MAG: enoyl-CoA hydratase/isomerase family protein, partial [Parcubacteria group bacterium]|nr:enoyl-CoA hydratase/isomerase family protein [Parcubacteria group bacterium]
MKYIETKVSDQMGIIVIQNPPRNNLSTPVMMELQSAFKEMEKNDAVEVVILTGKGLFSTGADVTEIWQIAQSNDVEKAKELLAKANSVANTIEDLTKPVIAAIDGYCLGGGNEIAMACGIRVASDQAQFGQPEINLGIMPGMGGTQRLPRLVTDVKKAVYMLVAGNIISARDAHAIHLVDFVVPQKDLIAKTKEIAKIIMEGDKEFDDLSSQLARPERTEADKQKIIEMISEDANFKTLSASKSPDAVQVILR